MIDLGCQTPFSPHSLLQLRLLPTLFRKHPTSNSQRPSTKQKERFLKFFCCIYSGFPATCGKKQNAYVNWGHFVRIAATWHRLEIQKIKNAESQKCRKSKMSKAKDRKSKMPKSKKIENQKCRKSKMSKKIRHFWLSAFLIFCISNRCLIWYWKGKNFGARKRKKEKHALEFWKTTKKRPSFPPELLPTGTRKRKMENVGMMPGLGASSTYFP